MSSLVSYADMEYLYETEGTTLIREPWGKPYDQTVGPDPKAPGVVLPVQLGSLIRTEGFRARTP